MYFKILRENLIHHGYTYHEGLNEDSNPFDPVPNCRGGLFFSDEKEVLGFCNYGTKIAEVTIPDGEAIVSVGEGYKAHRIILGQIRELWTKGTLEWIISCGADIHADDDYALYQAAKNGHLEVTKLLLEYRADVHADDDYALCLASSNGHVDVVKLLLESGANVHARADYALRFASGKGHLEVVRLLLESGANIHACDDYALCWASTSGHLDVVKFLVEFGANIHADNDHALHWASKNGQVEVVEYLKSLY